jgi:hypothetical protein
MRGILFKSDMIQAIIEGRKTATRRAEAGLREINKEPANYYNPFPSYDGTWGFHYKDYMDKIVYAKLRYQVGETVYIKETIRIGGNFPIYDSDKEPVMFYRSNNHLHWRWQKPFLSAPWLPEEAARYFLEITDVRAERLQEITESNIISEGCPDLSGIFNIDLLNEARFVWFKVLWNSINKDYPWESNPYVFVYTFRIKR